MSLFEEGDGLRARLDKVENLKDDDTLVEVACTADSAQIRLLAVSRLNDDEHLMQIVHKAPQLDVRLVAAERISSERLLADIIRSRNNLELIGICFSRITDKQIIEALAHDTSANPVARRMAVEYFADESYLAEATEAVEEERKSPEAVKAFIETYGGGVAGVRAIGRFRRSEKALRALGTIAGMGGEEGGLAIEYLCQGLASPNPTLRDCAAEELASLESPEVVTCLVRSLNTPDLREPIRAVLQRIGTPDARAALGHNGKSE